MRLRVLPFEVVEKSGITVEFPSIKLQKHDFNTKVRPDACAKEPVYFLILKSRSDGGLTAANSQSYGEHVNASRVVKASVSWQEEDKKTHIYHNKRGPKVKADGLGAACLWLIINDS